MEIAVTTELMWTQETITFSGPVTYDLTSKCKCFKGSHRRVERSVVQKKQRAFAVASFPKNVGFPSGFPLLLPVVWSRIWRNRLPRVSKMNWSRQSVMTWSENYLLKWCLCLFPSGFANAKGALEEGTFGSVLLLAVWGTWAVRACRCWDWSAASCAFV